MAVPGVFASDQNIVGTRRGDFASGILMTQPTGSAPLLALTSGMQSKNAVDTITTWFEESHIAGRFDIASFVTDGDGTGVVVDDASSVIVGAILMNEDTGEYVLVTAVTGNTITMQRAFAGTAATTMTADHNLQRIGTAHEEGSDRPVAIANLGEPKFNYMQIFRNSWDVTGTAKAVEYHTGDIVAKNRADAGSFHAEDIERSFVWGKKSVGIRNSKPFRTMDGVNAHIVTNVEAAGATTSYANLDDFFRDVFSKNVRGKPNERIAFTGNLGLSVLNNIALNTAQMNISVGETSFGLKVATWITPYGTVKVMTHPLMVESPFWTGDLYVYHPGCIRTRYLRNTNIDAYDANGQRAGVDADFGVYTTECLIEYHAEKTGGLFTGMTAAAAAA